jgi:hypothetical protein
VSTEDIDESPCCISRFPINQPPDHSTRRP